MFELKRLSNEGIEAALAKAERYRLLNEPLQAESICWDILEVDSANRRAVIVLILALTDQFGDDRAPPVEKVQSLLERLGGGFETKYYSGIICERRGMAYLKRSSKGSGALVFDWLSRAMGFYEEAEKVRPGGNDDPIIRWNTCARVIMGNPEVLAASDRNGEPIVE